MSEKVKPAFGKRYLEYIVESQLDSSDRIGKGVVGKGIYIAKDTQRKIKKGSILVEIESKTLFGDNGKPLKFKMIFESEREALQYLTFKKGGQKMAFYPNRDGDIL